MPSARMCVWSVAGKCIRAKLQNSFSSIFIARREPNAFYFIAQWSIIPSSCRMKFVCRLLMYSAQTLRKRPGFQNKTKQRRLFIYIFDVIYKFPLLLFSPNTLNNYLKSPGRPYCYPRPLFWTRYMSSSTTSQFIQLPSLKHWIGLHGKGLLPGQGGGRFAEIMQYNDLNVVEGGDWELGTKQYAPTSKPTSSNTNLRIQHLGGLPRPSASGRGGVGGFPPLHNPTPPHTSKIALIATRNSTTMDRKRMKNHHPSLTLKEQQFKNNKQTTLKHCSDPFYVTQEGTSGWSKSIQSKASKHDSSSGGPWWSVRSTS